MFEKHWKIPFENMPMISNELPNNALHLNAIPLALHSGR